jgi:uncharacterized membrane protein
MTLGFVTRESLDHLGLAGRVAVYVPQSYNFGGNLLALPTEQVRPLPVDSADLMAFIISGGVAGGAVLEGGDEPARIVERTGSV